MKIQKVMYWLRYDSTPLIGVAVVQSFDVSKVAVIVSADGTCLSEQPHDYMLLCGPLSYIDTEYKGA